MLTYTAQHSTAQHSTAQHSTAQHSTAQHSTALASCWQLSNIFAYTLLILLAIPTQIKAQNCEEAINIEAEVLFEIYDVDGRGYGKFIPSEEKIRLGIAATSQYLPTAYNLFSGDCSNLVSIELGTLYDPVDGFWYFTFDSLQIGMPYYFELSENTGNSFAVSGFLTEAIVSTPNCVTAHQCNYIVNPGFEQPDPSFQIPVGGSILNGQPFWALADEACGWERASTNPSCTPEYFLAPLDYSYGGPCGNKGQDGNSCINHASSTNGGKGVIQLFTIDERANNPQPDRREYVYTEYANGFMQESGVYALRVMVRHDPDVARRCGSLQANFVNGFTPVTHPGIINLGANEVDLSSQISLTNPNWQTIWEVFEYDGPPANNMVLGNFLTNAQSQAYIDATAPHNDPFDFIPKLYIDYVALFQLPNAGPDITICHPNNAVQIGFDPNCAPPAAGQLSLVWRNLNTNTIIGNTALINVTPTTLGVHNYSLSITYEGRTFVDYVSVTVAPELTTNTLGDDICDGQATFEIPNLSKWISWNFTSPNNSVTLSGQPTASGNALTFVNPVVNAYTGVGTVTGMVTYNFNGIVCTKQIDLQINACCKTFKTDYIVLPHGSKMSTVMAGAGLNINNTIFTVYGSVTIDDNYMFTDCQFYMMPDAQLTLAPAVDVDFINSSLQACGTFKWDRVLHTDATSTLTFDNCAIKDALRGLHTFNDATLDLNNTTFEDNIFSQIMENYTNAGATLSWNSNTYNIYGPAHNTQQHPASPILLTPWLGNQNIAVGIRGLSAMDLTLNGQNSFWCDYATNPEGIHLWLTNNSAGTVQNNQFYNGRNIVLDNSSLGIFDNNFSKLAGSQGGPTGISANQSALTVGQGTQPGAFSNVLLDGAAIGVSNPVATTIKNNQIESYLPGYCINIEASSPSYSHTVVQHNLLKGRWGIRLVNLNTNWLAQPGPRVLINSNNIFARRVDNQPNTTAVGISATNCEGISIGNNQDIVLEYAPGVSFPNATNAHLTKGIWLNNCRNAFVGCNNIHFAGQGLSFEYDVSKSFWNNYPTYPPNFQVNNFASCYYGMYLAPICTMPLEIGASTLAADNTWTTSQYLGPNITTVARIKDDRNALHKSPVTYYHSNPNNQGFNTDPMMGSTSNIQVTPNRPLNNCTIALPPSNKNEIVVKDEANRTSLVLYPNPANDILNYEISSQNQDLSLNYILKVFDVSGQLLYSIPGNSENGIINISALAAGVYIIQLRFNNELRIARFVKQ